MELPTNITSTNLADGDVAIRYLHEQEKIRRARSKRRWITFGAVLAALFVLMVGCGIAVGAAASGGSSSSASAATPRASVAPATPTDSGLREETRVVPVPPAATTAPVAPVAPETDAEAVGIYDEGTYVVGRDIAPGDYWTPGPTTDDYASWRRLSGLGGTSDETIALDSVEGPAQITISASDKAVMFYGPCQWTQVN